MGIKGQATTSDCMKKILTLIAVAGALNICHAQTFNAALSSLNEVPPNGMSTSDGTYGIASFSLSGDTLSVTSGFYGYSFAPTVASAAPNGTTPTEISINDGPATANGPVLFYLNVVADQFPVGGGLYDGTFTGSGILNSSEITDLESGDFYVNIQTANSIALEQPGEIRGQLEPTIQAVPDEPVTIYLLGASSLAGLALRRRMV
jgi:hypothetical protein